MTSQEKGLWTAVVVLTLGMVVMGTMMVMQGLRPQREDADASGETGRGDGNVIATINGEVITDKEWTDALKRRYGNELLLQMLNRKAVYAEALNRNLTVTPREISRELNAAMEGYDSVQAYYDEMQSQLGLTKEELELEAGYKLLLEKIATIGIQVRESDIEDYRSKHQEDFVTPEKYDLSLIVVKDRQYAEDLVDALKKGTDFEETARTESIDSYSRDSGGRLGWIEQTDPFQPEAIMNQAEHMQKGEIAGPVPVEEGYAILKMNDRKEKEVPSDEEIVEEIRMQLALSQADPLSQVEERLRDKYEAVIIAEIPAS